MSKSTDLIIKLALLGILLKITGEVYTGRPKEQGAFDHLFKRYADNPLIAKAVCKVESNINPSAIGDAGKAFGLMQIWYPTAKGHGYAGTPYGLLDPEINIYYATRELNHLLRKYGNYKGIMGYNIGETQLRKGKTQTVYYNKVQKALGEVTL
jgi:soluble lytic murein transglycosylase-like protein